MPTDACDSICCLNNGIPTPNRSYMASSFASSPAVVKQMVASSLGSVVATVVLNPINVMKVHMQSNYQNGGHERVVTCLRCIAGSRGMRGFWAGTSSGLLMSVPNTVMYMTTFEAIKERLHPYAATSAQRSLLTGCAGFLARVVAVSVISPIELIRTLQSAGRKEGIARIATDIYAQNGLRGLYRGWLSTILRDCPYSAIYWFGFDSTRPVYQNLLGGSDSSIPFPLATFLSGATAGLVAAFISHPLDVLKTKRQLTLMPQAAGEMTRSSLLPFPTLSSVMREEGLVGIYRGLSMRLITIIPASAIMITVYESVKNLGSS